MAGGGAKPRRQKRRWGAALQKWPRAVGGGCEELSAADCRTSAKT